MNDWPSHKKSCTTKTLRSNQAIVSASNTISNPVKGDEPVKQSNGNKAIWTEEPLEHRSKKITWSTSTKIQDNTAVPTNTRMHVNFDKAFKDLGKETPAYQDIQSATSIIGNGYLNNNQLQYDAPVLDPSKDMTSIVVRAHKTKHRVDLNLHWEGIDTMKYISHTIKVPLDKLKLIHKGKKVEQDNIKKHIMHKAVFQAIGEQAESEDDIDTTDIDVMMRQVSVERNEAIRALRDTDDVVDAILKVSNK